MRDPFGFNDGLESLKPFGEDSEIVVSIVNPSKRQCFDHRKHYISQISPTITGMFFHSDREGQPFLYIVSDLSKIPEHMLLLGPDPLNPQAPDYKPLYLLDDEDGFEREKLDENIRVLVVDPFKKDCQNNINLLAVKPDLTGTFIHLDRNDQPKYYNVIDDRLYKPFEEVVLDQLRASPDGVATIELEPKNLVSLLAKLVGLGGDDEDCGNPNCPVHGKKNEVPPTATRH